jgi:integrase
LIRATPARIDTDLLFATPSGTMWIESNFRRDVWNPAREAAGLDVRPHDCRHSRIAQMAGHTVDAMLGVYTHALGRSHDAVRELLG